MMLPFNDKDRAFLYILKEIVDKFPANKNKRVGCRPERSEITATYQMF
jgi:hypothetical protein